MKPVLESPKSCAFPNEAIVAKSITFIALGFDPPIQKPLVELEHDIKLLFAEVKSPKSTEFPVDEMVTY